MSPYGAILEFDTVPSTSHVRGPDPASAFPYYDDVVPHPAPNSALANRFAELRQRAIAAGGLPDLGQVRDVVVVVSSSRGGSSHFAALLRRCSQISTLPAELNSLVTIAHLGPPEKRMDVLAQELALQLGQRATQIDEEAIALEARWRMLAQWPSLRLPSHAVEKATAEALGRLRSELRSSHLPHDIRTTRARLTRALLERLQSIAPRLDSRHYDLGERSMAPAGPPQDLVIEMTPYVSLPLWRRATSEELATHPVVLTTPRLSWRLPAIRALFPNACVRVVHLVRNPGASINGLIDAWLHPGFFNVQMPETLRIAGYSDRFPEWGRSWWKLDVPPNWRSLIDRPLPEVAAAQWREPHTAVLTDEALADVHRIRHEDLVGDPAVAETAARSFADFIGIDADAFAAIVHEGVPPVMATVPPQPGRWRSRMAELAPVLADPAIRELADVFGYGPDPERWR